MSVSKDFNVIGEVPLLSHEVNVSVEFIYQESSETIILGTYFEPCRDTFPNYSINWPFAFSLTADKKQFSEPYCEVLIDGFTDFTGLNEREFEMPKIESVEVFLCLDGKKIASYSYDEAYTKENELPTFVDETGQSRLLYFKRPEKLKLDPDRIYEEHILVRDEYGRYMEVICTEAQTNKYYYIEEPKRN